MKLQSVMETLSKDELLEQSSLAVQQIRKKFAQGENVIKDCQETVFLCQCVDNILHHGLKDGLISRAMEFTIWSMLEKITCSEDLHEIKILHLKTDRDKCYAWIRMAVNQNLLGSYIATVRQDKSLLSNHYHEHAFLRDPIMTDTVQSILNNGITNFDFDISVRPQTLLEHNNIQNLITKPQTIHDSFQYDIGKTRENGCDGDESLQRTAHVVQKKKKQRRKKLQVKTVVIEEQEHYDDTELPETLRNTNISLDPCDEHEEAGKMTSPADEGVATQCVENSETQTLLLKNTSSNKITDHNGVDRTQVCDQTKGFIGKDIVENTLGNSENYKEPELSERIEAAVSISSKKMFDANDFLLEESIDENSFVQNKYNVNDCRFEDNARTKNESTDDKSHEVHVTHSTAETKTRTNDDVSTEEFEHKGGKDTVVDVEGETFNSKNKDTTDECEKSSFETPKSIHRSSSSETNNVTEVSSGASFYDYRVRKVENPELVSSSYGSSFSDYTDDDKDLNFIPGIHRMSTKSIASSLERKSSGESAVSFDKNGFPVFESSHFTNSASLQRSSNEESTNKQTVDESDMFEDLLNVNEEHFSNPDNFAGLTASEELEIAIEHYKKMIMKRQEKSLPKDDLVDKLVKLRLRLQQEKDTPPVDDTKFHKILGHHFRKQEGSSGVKYFCDHCGKNIWTVWQSLFTCKDCGYHCHPKCLDQIQRSCVNKNLSTASYIFEICPDGGLDGQQYKCAECRRPIAFSKKDSVARICDYTGQYFCDSCHWNDHTIIPARVLRNWDFTPHKVCRSSKQLLELMKTKLMVNIQEINPQLFRYVEELREIGKLREDILIMKKYFLTCREALESKLLIRLKKRQHFVDNADMYSFQDLIDLNNDILLPEISKIHAIFLAHIKADCDLCRARGFICELCQDSSDVIFAFDPHAVKCSKCSAVYHKMCFRTEDCPKCRRRKKITEQK